MMKTKKRVLFNSTIIMLLILSMFFIGSLTVLAKSSSVSFTMNWDGRYINGKNNGVYHSLSAGGVQIRGTIENTYTRPGAVGPNTITIELWNKTTGNYFGSVKVTPKANSRKSFSGTFSSVGGGNKYYLIIYRANADGRRMVGNATLSNI